MKQGGHWRPLLARAFGARLFFGIPLLRVEFRARSHVQYWRSCAARRPKDIGGGTRLVGLLAVGGAR